MRRPTDTSFNWEPWEGSRPLPRWDPSSKARRVPTRLRPSRAAKVVAVLVGLAACVATVVPDKEVGASSGEGTIDPNGRGLQLLGGREAILLEQSERARRVARARAAALYRLLRFVVAEQHDGQADDWSHLGGRAVALATVVLARDLDEAQLLRAELNRVRAERAGANLVAISPDGRPGIDEGSSSPLLKPVRGELVTPFGVARDRATGAWIFRAAATYAAGASESVRSPATGRIVRVANSVAGGVAVVLAHDGRGWTSVISGLDSVAVSAGDVVHRGDSLGRASSVARQGRGRPIRIEIWHGRTPMDPGALLRAL